MRNIAMISALILASCPAVHGMNLRVQEGRPIVDGVYVNGHGPYRFLLDTGTNVNLIDANLGHSIGLNVTFQVDLGTATGKTSVSGSDGNEVALDMVEAAGQKFLLSPLEAIHSFSSDIQGVLGQWFLSGFDYTIDLQGKRFDFGKQDRSGTRVPLTAINGRLAIHTSLGDLILDSGAAGLVLFGHKPDEVPGNKREWRTVAGSQEVYLSSNNSVIINGRTVWRGSAVAMSNQGDPGVAGLLPLRFFKAIFVCNSEGYAILE